MRISFKRFISSILVFIILTSGLVFSNDSFEETHVLMISSYSPSFMTFFDQIEGVKHAFEHKNIVLDVEFMDSKRYYNDENLTNFETSLTYKMRQMDYDLIVTSDDNALNFVLEHQEDLFEAIPIVFLGVNNLETAAKAGANPWITGVVEASSLDKTIDIALELNPNAKHIVAITDPTTSGQGDLKRFFSLSESYSDYEMSAIDLSNYTYEAFKKELRTLNQEDVVILLSVYSDKDNNRVHFYDGLRMVVANTNQPVYHPYMHGLGDGIIGGKVISHFEQGRTAGQLALRVINGEPIADMDYIQTSPNQYVFDYNIMTKHNLGINQLPEDSLVLNYKESFIRKYWAYILVCLAIILLQGVMIYALIKNLQAKKKYEVELNKSHLDLKESHEEVLMLNDELEKRVLERTEQLENTNEELAITIEDLKQMQDRLLINQAMKSYLELSRKLAHFINTPLGSALTTSTFQTQVIRELDEVLEDNNQSIVNRLRETNTSTVENIRKAISVVDELQTFAVYEPSVKRNLSVSIFNLLELLKTDAKLFDCQIETELDESILVDINEKVFHKILKSLIENAYDYGGVNDLKVIITLRRETNAVLISIQDNGHGIRDLSNEEVFKPFYTSNPHRLGMGLFLSECYVYETLQGSLTLDADYKEGAKFDIRIPK